MADAPEQYVTGFSPAEWSPNIFRYSATTFVGAGFLTFLLCLLLMIFIPPLRDFFIVVGACNVMAFAAMIAVIVTNVRGNTRHMQKMTDRTNTFMVEATGDPSTRITTGGMQTLILNKQRGLPLQINGVPGLEIKAVRRDSSTQFRAILTRPDYGLDSFDVLLEAESQARS